MTFSAIICQGTSIRIQGVPAHIILIYNDTHSDCLQQFPPTFFHANIGITPASASKSPDTPTAHRPSEDHPR